MNPVYVLYSENAYDMMNVMDEDKLQDSIQEFVDELLEQGYEYDDIDIVVAKIVSEVKVTAPIKAQFDVVPID